MRKLLPLLAIAALVLVACGPPGPRACTVQQIAEYEAAVANVVSRFDDAVTIANNTGRGQLSPQIAELQAVRRDAEAIEIPECAAEAHRWLIEYMNATISAFLAFQAQEHEYDVEAAFYLADGAQQRYGEALALIAESPDATLPPVPTPTLNPCHPSLLADEWQAIMSLNMRWLSARRSEDIFESMTISQELRDLPISDCFGDYKEVTDDYFTSYIDFHSRLQNANTVEAIEALRPLAAEVDAKDALHSQRLQEIADQFGFE